MCAGAADVHHLVGDRQAAGLDHRVVERPGAQGDVAVLRDGVEGAHGQPKPLDANPVTGYTVSMTKTLWRAANEAETGTTACYAEAREDAEAYLDNPGFGGRNLYRVTLDPAAVIFDATKNDLRDIYGDRVDAFDHAYQAVHEDEGQALVDAGYTHVRFEDDYPENAITVMRVDVFAEDEIA